MASTYGTSVAVFTWLWIFVLTSAGQQQITAKTGDNVTLQCVNESVGDIELLEWKRRDQEENVFVWKHEKMSEDDQHESFKYRVELIDPQMKDGDVSVILKNVNNKDTGTYECRVKNSNTQPPPQLITTVTVTVIDSGGGAGRSKDGGNSLGLIVSVLVVNTLLLAGIVYMTLRIWKWKLKKSDTAAQQLT